MLYGKRKAFTMIELVFVIVVLGILAAVAVPRLAATRDDAQIAKGRSDVSAIRSAIISERQTRLFRGQSNFINRLDAGVSANAAGVTLFDHNGTAANTILQYGITSGLTAGHWVKVNATTYRYILSTGNTDFVYSSTTGIFDCAGGAGTNCALLTD